jgi:hypothetical protein
MTLRPHKRNVRGDVDALRPYVASRSKTGGYTAVTGSGRNNLLGGHVGGFTIGTYTITSDNGQVGLNSEITDGVDYRIWAGSTNASSAPFRVDEDGNLVSQSGTIAGWNISSTSLSKNNATLSSNGYLELGTGSDLVRVDAQNSTYRLWVGDITPSNAPFHVTKGGGLTATVATITGTIDANDGYLGNLEVDGVLTVGDVAPFIRIDGPNKRIMSTNYVSGVAGVLIEANGNAEFNNVLIRGEMRSSVFVVDEIHAEGGTMIVLEAGNLETDVTIIT